MKNLFLIPTDKPSKLHLIEDTLTITSDYKNSVCDGEVNIYITSDEEIKEGDCVIDNVGRIWIKMELCFVKVAKDNPYGKSYKIILTTDQDLINNGVQEIDNEFLEWFVQNPSCEEVNIDSKLIVKQTKPLIQHQGSKPIVVPYKIEYKIIIPKEEPQQETLEEAAEKFSKVRKKALKDKKEWMPECIYHESFNGFIVGAEYQADRMYSEEEVLETIRQYALEEHLITSSKPDKWFEQFKKK